MQATVSETSRSAQRVLSHFAVALVSLCAACAVLPGAALALPPGCAQSGQTVTCTDVTTGESHFTVPSNATAVEVQAVGGTGGGESEVACTPYCGGAGAIVTGRLPVTAGEVLTVQVAGNGEGGSGGYGGGAGGSWGSGGASLVSSAGSDLLVAAGGGGEGYRGTGLGAHSEVSGGAPGSAGGEGGNTEDDGRGGAPGTGIAGGAGGAAATGGGAHAGEHGTLGAGGEGGGSATLVTEFGGAGAGGGGGYYGGGGGGGGSASEGMFAFAGAGGGGGGGSNLVPAGGSSTLDTSASPRVVISYNVIAFTSGAPPAGPVGQAYGYAYSAVGDTGITYAVTGGTLPPGLSLSPTGTLSGTPTVAGSYSYTVTATGATANQSRADTITIVKSAALPSETASTIRLVGSPSASSAGVSFSISCSTPTGAVCDFQARLSTLEHLLGSKIVGLSSRSHRLRRRSAMVTVGETTLSVSAGHSRRVSITLNTTGSDLLKRFHKLPVTLTVTLESDPPKIVKATATIRERRKHKHRR